MDIWETEDTCDGAQTIESSSDLVAVPVVADVIMNCGDGAVAFGHRDTAAKNLLDDVRVYS